MEVQDKLSSPQIRQPKPQKKGGLLRPFAESFLIYFPDLKKKLYLANSPETPGNFLEKAITASIYVGTGLTVLLGMILQATFVNPLFALAGFPFLLAGMFGYMMLYPEARIIARQRQIETELVFAGRHILIALRAGMPLFDAFVGVSYGYGAVSEEFRKIVERINLGVPMGQAMREAGANSPSNAYSRILMQLSNAISSGADVGSSLEVVLSQIAKEQTISLKEYGQKLNPLVMFFMIFGIIFPSLGVAFAIILFSLVSGGSIGLNSTSLFYVMGFIAIVQFVFLSIVESSRPKYVI